MIIALGLGKNNALTLRVRALFLPSPRAIIMFVWTLRVIFLLCLPLRETYIVFPSVYVRPSVRASVRPFVCYAFLVRAISPRTLCAKHLQKIPKITYLLKLCYKKSKFINTKILEVLAKQPLFKFVFCSGQISLTIKDRDTGFFCSVSKNIPIVQH